MNWWLSTKLMLQEIFYSYRVAFGNRESETIIKLGEQHAIFIDKLWLAVGIQLLRELLETVGSGMEIEFGNGKTLVRDEGITLTKHTFFGKPICSFWSQIQIESKGGIFRISAKDDKKTYVKLSYHKDVNVHVLEYVKSSKKVRPNSLTEIFYRSFQQIRIKIICH
jgi:hypothetical protein